MDFQLARSLPVDQWQTFVKKHPKGNIFHTPEMYEVFRNTKGYSPDIWAVLKDSHILALILPVHIALTKSGFKRLTTRSVVFGGALCEESPTGKLALAELLRQYKLWAKRSSLFTELRNLDNHDDLQPILGQAGFEYEDHLNYLIPLNCSTGLVFDRIGSRTRKHIRRGIKRRTVRVVEVRSKEQITDCYKLLGYAYRNAQVPLADISLFYAAFEHLVPKGMARFALAYVGTDPAVVSIELLYKEMIYGWYGGTDRKFSSEVPNEILIWEILQWGCEHGYQVYDFGGAGKPNEEYGVRNFKAKFGGDLVCFGRNTWVPNPVLMSGSKFAYSILRKFLF